MGRRSLLAAGACLALAGSAPVALAHHDDKNVTLYLEGSTTFLLSKSTGGGIPDGPSRNAAISEDQRIARFAAFESDATNLVSGDGNGLTDVFLIRRKEPFGNDGTEWVAGPTQLASPGMGGQPANGRSYLPALDGDSKNPNPHCLAFLSDASNLVPGDTNGLPDVFVRDLDTGSIKRVSVSSTGQQANGPSFDVALNGDCSRVAFTSTASNLALTRTKKPNLKSLVTGGAVGGNKQIYVRILPGDAKDGDDLVGLTFLASATNKRAGNADSFDPQWSRPGKALVFTSRATNLSQRDSAGNSDVYMRTFARRFAKYKVIECKTKKKRGRRVKICRRTLRGKQTIDMTTRLISDGGNGDSSNPSITDDARLVAYQTTASNIADGDTNGHSDVIRADTRSDPPKQLLLSTTKSAISNGDSYNPMITAAGVAVFFDSDATNLKMFPYFIDDANGVRDMFVGIPIHGSAGVDSLTWENHYADGVSENPVPSARHNYVLFESTAGNIDQSIPNPARQRAIFLRYDGPFSGDAVTEP